MTQPRARTIPQADRGPAAAVALLLAAVAALPGCATGAADGPTAFAVGGTVSGLLPGATLVLSGGGADHVTVSANGSFAFPALLANGVAYAVIIETQPVTLRCVVRGGSGTIHGAAVTSVAVDCPVAVEGGLAWMRCTQGQRWNPSASDCTGAGTAVDRFGAVDVQFCSDYGNACNGGTPGGLLTTPTGGLTSSLLEACASLNAAGGTYGIGAWRVPTVAELKGLVSCSGGPAAPLPDFTACAAGSRSPTIDTALFPDTVASSYLSATPFDSNYVYGIFFGNGFTNNEPKVYASYQVRCVAGP